MANSKAALITSHPTCRPEPTTKVDSRRHVGEPHRRERRQPIHRQTLRSRHSLVTCLHRLRAHLPKLRLLQLQRLCLTPQSSVQRFGVRLSRSQAGPCQMRYPIARTPNLQNGQNPHASHLFQKHKISLTDLDRGIRRLQRKQQGSLTKWISIQIPRQERTQTLRRLDRRQHHPRPGKTKRGGQARYLLRLLLLPPLPARLQVQV